MSPASPRDDRWPGPGLSIAGLVAVLVISAGGLFALDVGDQSPPEQQAIGIVPPKEPRTGRGMAVSMGVTIGACDERVRVILLVTGTAEYWIDRAKDLRGTGKIGIAIPGTDIGNVEVRLGRDGALAPTAPFTESAKRAEPELAARARLRRVSQEPRNTMTMIEARLEAWGTHLRPLVVTFDADWLSPRGHLGSCFLELPALAGPATVLSAQEFRGKAVYEDDPRLDLTRGTKICRCSILKVSSEERERAAFYLPWFETTNGLTALDLGQSTLEADLSLPAPDGNVRGLPSWTCTTRPPTSFRFLENPGPGGPELVKGIDDDATTAQSTRRLGTTLTQRTCASFAVIQEASAQLKRDVVLVILGAMVPFAMALAVNLARYRRA